MIKRKQLGQHFLNSNSIAASIVSEAKITSNDIVFELGTGLGILTPLLCEKASKVISVDIDEELVSNAKSNFSDIDNLILKSGDGLKEKTFFFHFCIKSTLFCKQRCNRMACTVFFLSWCNHGSKRIC